MSKNPDTYLHKEKRKNNPDAGLSSFDKSPLTKQKYEYDPHLDPQLQWTGKNERTSFEVPIISLLTQEKINPKHIIKNYLTDKTSASTLDKFFDKLPKEKRIEFYKHNKDWTNRLILGDSLLIMNSLLNKEGMAGKIQMIYMDPPYGVEYNSNFQVESNSRNVKDGKDDSLTREPEQIKAFRDTWELGIHSYLSYLRDRILLSKLLLKEEGSIFIQINNENLVFVTQILIEVFGKENLISIIPFKKTTGKTSNTISNVCDFIIWFSKNKEKMKYHQLFYKKQIDLNTLKLFNKIELEDGERRSLTQKEKETGLLPKNSKLFMTQPLTSQHYSKTRSVPYEYNGKTYHPSKNRQWCVSLDGLDVLKEEGRIYEGKSTIRFVYYFDDFPIDKVTNLWDDTYNEANPIYVVQTSEKVIKRCMLMTTDPGDLVFDPTSGSGTTPYVAEEMGRRWIACDTSKVAINLAKQRIITSFYDYFKLKDESNGIDFNYKKYPHISASTIAYNKEIEYEVMYDKPEILSSKIRVSGPFTLETISSSQIMVSLEDAIEKSEEEKLEIESYMDKVLFYLTHDGLSYPRGKKQKLDNISRYDHAFIHAQAEIETNGNKEKVAISIGPEFGNVDLLQVEQAFYKAIEEKFDWLIVIGFSFDEMAQLKLLKNKPENLKVEIATINPDIEIEDLQKQPSGAQMFTVFGEPQIKIHDLGDGNYQVEILSIETYDPQTGLLNEIKLSEIGAWFIDENFDDHTFMIHQAIFPNDEKFEKNIKKELTETLDKNKISYISGKKSIPFKVGESKKIAVKIIDLRGNELITIHNLK